MEIILSNPTFWAVLGAAAAFFLAGIGSSRGCGIAGQTAAGVVAEDPTKFVPGMILTALPSSQSIYGFVIAIMIIGKIDSVSTLEQGFALFAAGLPVGVVGLMSALYQGKVAAAGVNLIAKRSDALGSAITYALIVEMFAILGFVISIFMM